MTKIYEALELAGKARIVQTEEAIRPVAAAKSPMLIDPKLVALCESLNGLLDSSDKAVIAFVGVGTGAETSLTAFGCARAAALWLRKSVVMVTAGTPAQVRQTLTEEALRGWSQTSSEATDGSILYAHPEASLSVALVKPFDSPGLSVARNGTGYAGLLDSLKERYGWVVADATSWDKRHVATATRSFDGFVLVVRADRTRWQDAWHIREQVEMQGSKVLGVVLNS